MMSTLLLVGLVLFAALAVYLVVLLAQKWDPRSLSFKVFSFLSSWELFLLDRVTEEERERRRLEKRNNRKPGRLTDFE